MLAIRSTARVRTRTAWALLAAALAIGGFAVAAPSAQARSVHVWRVGTWHGVRGNVATIAAALRKARPGDWILIGPGDYQSPARQP
jgi:hypothetical protein